VTHKLGKDNRNHKVLSHVFSCHLIPPFVLPSGMALVVSTRLKMHKQCRKGRQEDRLKALRLDGIA
jgi:hypothetical protein